MEMFVQVLALCNRAGLLKLEHVSLDGSKVKGYNCQAVVDEENQLIVAEGVTNQAPDQEHLVPMMKRVKSNTGRTPTVLTADTGYMSSGNATYCSGEGIDAFIARQITEKGRSQP